MLRFLILLVVLTVANGNVRRSPNAERVRQITNKGQLRYSNNVIEDATLDVPDLVAKYGYPIEVHTVTTEDGYILEAHRIPYGRDQNNVASTNKSVAFILHGIGSSSADYILSGPGKALGYLLAEEGYDVWIANARGNYYSRNHVSYNPDEDVDFWKFSFDHMGYYDLKAYIDYVLEVTGQSKLHYIGHSQGGASFFALTTLRPEYNDKIFAFQGLAPAVFFRNTENALYKWYAPYWINGDAIAFATGRVEWFTNNNIFTWIGANLCSDDSSLQSMCYSMLSRSLDEEYYNKTMMPLILGHNPAGFSYRQITHFAQNIESGEFRRFNYGTLQNLAIYNQTTAPDYDLSLVTTPVHLHYALGDADVHPNDILLLASKVGNLGGTYLVGRETFNHFDFHWGVDQKEMVYNNMFKLMKAAEEDN